MSFRKWTYRTWGIREFTRVGSLVRVTSRGSALVSAKSQAQRRDALNRLVVGCVRQRTKSLDGGQ